MPMLRHQPGQDLGDSSQHRRTTKSQLSAAGGRPSRSISAASRAGFNSSSTIIVARPRSRSPQARRVCSSSPAAANGTRTIRAPPSSPSTTVLYPAWETETRQLAMRIGRSSRWRSTVQPAGARSLRAVSAAGDRFWPPISSQGSCRKPESDRAASAVCRRRSPTAPPPALTRTAGTIPGLRAM